MDESPYLLKQKIQAEARSLGFSACGAVGVEEAEEAVVRRYEAWVGAGECDGMDYMRRYADVRRSPARLMPGAKTMLCLALPYAPARRLRAEVPQIACYAYGEDYHEVMRRRLFRLLERVRALLLSALCADGREAHCEGDAIALDKQPFVPLYTMEPLSADAAAQLLRRYGGAFTLACNALTPDAEKLLASFGVRTMKGDEAMLPKRMPCAKPSWRM